MPNLIQTIRHCLAVLTLSLLAAAMSSCAPAATAPSGAPWPPHNIMRAGQTWSVQFQGGQSFNGRITGKDSDGDWTGTGNGGQTLFSFSLRDGSFVFQVLERVGGPSWLCALPDAKSVAGAGRYNGVGLYIANKDAEVKSLQQSCVVSLR